MASNKINVLKLGSVHYRHADLEKARDFLRDFGMQEVLTSSSQIFFAGYGVDPYCYLAEHCPGSASSFVGSVWLVESYSELEKATALPHASSIHKADAPGGGDQVTISDPNGFSVTFIHGQQERKKPETQDLTFAKDQAAENQALNKPRQGQVRRYNVGPSPVHKLGHFGFIVPEDKFKETFRWYTTTLNLKPTDSVYNPVSGDDTTCFMHIDRGLEFTDHHTLFIGASSKEKHVRVHHSSFEVNDFDTQVVGHDHLRNRGWTNCWGLGRHVLGSQIFDYWFDASNFILEHYSDGDVVNSETPWGREPEAPDSLYVWGPNLPLSFFTGNPEHGGIAVADVEGEK